MTDIITDERLAEIRAGLMGTTPGPWVMEVETSEHVDESEEDRQPEVYVCSSDTCCDYTVVATMGRAEAIRHDRKSRDASHIARLDPQTVAALLARLDKAEEGWQDISTAPRDGTPVDLWARCYDFVSRDSDERRIYGEFRVPGAIWFSGEWSNEDGNSLDLDGWSDLTFTHWRPVPAPPPIPKEG